MTKQEFESRIGTVMSEEIIKTIKGFDHNLSCRDFKYEVGKTYEMDGDPELCEKGFHAIAEDDCPLSVFDYYPPCDENGIPNRFCEVELSGKMDKNSEKIAASKIEVKAEIGIHGLVKAHIEWVRKHLKKEGEVHDTENYSSASNTGDRSSASNTGDRSSASNTGNRSSASNTGYCSSASNTGDYSSASNTGYYSSAKVTGKESVAIVTGKDSRASGALGCWLVLTERGEWDGETRPILDMKAVKVDGEKIKPDTWYMLKDGEIVEAE